jgi:DNA-binding NtrC family response regulator
MANILVVDDEMGIRELLSEILGDEGHVVTTAEDANQARDLRLSSSPDLVLLDIWMPDIDGVTLLKEWQRDGLLTMPVIMMSGHATIDTAVEATRIGAINFLEKPISLQKLLRTVQQGLSSAPESARGTMVTANGRSNAITDKTAIPATPHSFNGHSYSPTMATTGNQYLPPDTEFRVSFELPLREARDAFERAYFEHHLKREGGSMTRVAERTGLERTHLYRKLKQLGVESIKASKKT